MATDTLTVQEAADLLGVHPDTLRKWADSGEVPSWRTPGGWRRFSTVELNAWRQKRTQRPAPETAA